MYTRVSKIAFKEIIGLTLKRKNCDLSKKIGIFLQCRKFNVISKYIHSLTHKLIHLKKAIFMILY